MHGSALVRVAWCALSVRVRYALRAHFRLLLFRSTCFIYEFLVDYCLSNLWVIVGYCLFSFISFLVNYCLFSFMSFLVNYCLFSFMSFLVNYCLFSFTGVVVHYCSREGDGDCLQVRRHGDVFYQSHTRPVLGLFCWFVRYWFVCLVGVLCVYSRCTGTLRVLFNRHSLLAAVVH